MTREEALSRAIMTHIYFQAHFCKSKEAVNNTQAIIDTLEQIERETRWIPVSERLPEDAQTVLVTRACRRNRRWRYFVETGEIISGTWISPNDEYRIEVDSYTVIAWMPLPEPYKAESEDKEYVVM